MLSSSTETAQRRLRQAAIVALSLLIGCSDSDTPPVSPASDVRYAFVVLGENGQAIARAITVASACPLIAIDGGHPVQMTLRAAAATLPARPTAYDKRNTVPADFPVTVCDANVAPGASRATIGTRVLPLPKAHPQKILLIGDTGCRLKGVDNVGQYQACNDSVEWPFKAIADIAAAHAPDVVIHVGDYHYRETPCPSGNIGCAGSPYGFSWSSWEPDFFAPADALLAAAPWILVRGDHEICDRGGQGWWRMLDPRPLTTKQDCNDPADDGIGNYSEPYAVPLDDDMLFVVFDSSVVGDKALDAGDAQYRQYAAQFVRAFALAAARPHAFFMNHQPILGYNSDETPTALPGNEALQSVLKPIVPVSLFPQNVEAVLSGHVHMLQIVNFATPQPPIFIPGNGGTDLVPEFTKYPPGPTPLPGAVVANQLATARFGFMTMERGSAGWVLTGWSRRGLPITSCTLFEKKVSCTPFADG
ncbi:MAG: metallophosphoesterase [Casimicrobiaceae bacterium]